MLKIRKINKYTDLFQLVILILILSLYAYYENQKRNEKRDTPLEATNPQAPYPVVSQQAQTTF